MRWLPLPGFGERSGRLGASGECEAMDRHLSGEDVSASSNALRVAVELGRRPEAEGYDPKRDMQAGGGGCDPPVGDAM